MVQTWIPSAVWRYEPRGCATLKRLRPVFLIHYLNILACGPYSGL